VSFAAAADQSSHVDLAPYVAAGWIGQRLYVRTDLSEPQKLSSPYRQATTISDRLEGSLYGLSMQPLAAYLDPHGHRRDRPHLDWPAGPERSHEFFVEFDRPLAEWPLRINRQAPAVMRSRLKAYDGDGLPFADGSAVRRVWFEGYEDVAFDRVQYAECLRLRAETELRFGWWASVRLQEHVWLVRDVGVVRRVERLAGRALLTRFRSAHRFDLKSHEPLNAQTTDCPTFVPRPPSAPRWSRLAIHLDRSLPNPRVGGLIVELRTGRSAVHLRSLTARPTSLDIHGTEPEPP